MTKVQTIKPDAIITIEVNGNFYARVQALTNKFMSSSTKEELTEQITKIKKDESLSEFGENLQTLLVLIQEIELKAKEQDKITEIEVE